MSWTMFRRSSCIIDEHYRYVSYLYNISPEEWKSGIYGAHIKIRFKYALSSSNVITILFVKELIDKRDDITGNYATKQHPDA